MVTRTVTVRLRADISNYNRNMRQASDNTSKLTYAGAAASAALLAGFAAAASEAAKFDKALSNVRAVSGAGAKDMAKLRAAALDAGKSTAFSAMQAADAEAELARAGVSVADITGGALKGSLALAASGQIDLSESAVIAAQAMNTFGLAGEDVSHIADVLSAGANKSASDVHGLGESLRMGGLLAHQTGLSLEDTVGVLSAFADHALIGSDAGTSLKTMLQRLVPQSQEAQDAMDKVGLSAYDAQGNFVGLSELAGRMKTSFSKLTPEARNSAMATIFGSDAVRSATILYELGSQGIDKYVSSVNDQGAAQRMASIQMDNLQGDLTRLKGAIQVALIEGGSAANGALRGMAQWATNVVNAYNNLPPSLQHAVTGFAGVGGAVGLAVTGLLLLMPRIAATRTALAAMGVTAATARSAMMGLGRLTIVVGALEAMSYASRKVGKALEDAPPSVSKLSSSLVDLAQKGKASGEAARVFGGDLKGFGDDVGRIAHAGVLDRVGDSLYNITHLGSDAPDLERARNRIKDLDESLAALVSGGHADVAADAFKRLSTAAEDQGTSVEKLQSLLPGYTDALANTSVEQKTAGKTQQELADTAKMSAAELKDQTSAVEKLTGALKDLNGINIDSAEKEIAFQKSLKDMTDAVTENGHSLDVTSEKGRQVKSAFLDAAQAAMAHAEAVAQQKDSVDAGNQVLAKDIQALRDTMAAAGFSTDAINKLTDAYAQLPVSKETAIRAQTQGALANLSEVQKKLANTKGKSVTVNALTRAAEHALVNLGFQVEHMKDGTVQITIPTGGPRAAVGTIQNYVDSVRGKSVYVNIVTTHTSAGSTVAHEGGNYARGGRIRGYAGGGNVVQYMPFGGAVYGPGTGTSDSVPLWASNGEYMIKEAAVRKYGIPMFDALNAGRFASGGLVGVTYTPTGAPMLGTPTDAKGRYDDLTGKLNDAWKTLSKTMATARDRARDLREAEANLRKVRSHRHTEKQLEAAEKKLRSAREANTKATQAVTGAKNSIFDLDKQLGLAHGAKTPSGFSLTAYSKLLGDSLRQTTQWRASLDRIQARGGTEVRDILEAMGEDGYALVQTLARASDKQFKDIVAKLKATAGVASASLADFTKQVGAANKTNAEFASDLEKLAAQGYGDLAQALAAMGGPDAAKLAHEAAGGKAGAVTAANNAVKQNAAALSGEDLANALVLLTTLRSGTGRGFADLIAAGLDVATIRALVPRIMAQINTLPAANKATFLQQWAGQGGGVAMARGGILTQPSAVLAAEAGDAESWIPINSSARSRSLLAATARLMGYDARPAGRFAGGSSAAPVVQHVTKHIEVHLHGAQQDSATQAADVARHLSFVS